MSKIKNSAGYLVWGKEYPNLPPLDLNAIQKESYANFLENLIPEGLAEISPVEDFTGKNWLLIFGKPVSLFCSIAAENWPISIIIF